MAGKVDVIINADGTVELDAHGFKGKGCKAVTDALTRGLGDKTDEGKKPDYFCPEPSKSTVQVAGGEEE